MRSNAKQLRSFLDILEGGAHIFLFKIWLAFGDPATEFILLPLVSEYFEDINKTV